MEGKKRISCMKKNYDAAGIYVIFKRKTQGGGS